MAPTGPGEFDELLLMLMETRGFDFTGYKRSMLERRVSGRTTLLNLATFGEYRSPGIAWIGG